MYVILMQRPWSNFILQTEANSSNGIYSLNCVCSDEFKLIPDYLGRPKRIWYLSPMRAAKVQASLRIRAVLPEPPLLAHTSSESRGNFRQKARSLAPLNGWACAVKICHDGMLEDTNSLDGAHLFSNTVKSTNLKIFYTTSCVLPELVKLIKHAHPAAPEMCRASKQCFLVYK